MSVLYINFKNTGIIYLLNEIILFVYCVCSYMYFTNYFCHGKNFRFGNKEVLKEYCYVIIQASNFNLFKPLEKK